MTFSVVTNYIIFAIMTRPAVNSEPYFWVFFSIYVAQEVFLTSVEIFQVCSKPEIMDYILDVWNFADVFKVISSWALIY